MANDKTTTTRRTIIAALAGTLSEDYAESTLADARRLLGEA